LQTAGFGYRRWGSGQVSPADTGDRWGGLR
jgi:hypothetical protein